MGSAIEHSAVREPLLELELERRGFEVAWAPVDGDGTIDLTRFAELVDAGNAWPRSCGPTTSPARWRRWPSRSRLSRAGRAPARRRGAGTRRVPAGFRGVRGGDDGALGAQARRAEGRWCAGRARPGADPAADLGWGPGGRPPLGTENVAGAVGFAAARGGWQGRADGRQRLRDRLEASLPSGPTVIGADAVRLPAPR